MTDINDARELTTYDIACVALLFAVVSLILSIISISILVVFLP